MASLGLGFDDLAAINPALIYVSITAFGQTGPKRGYAASDLIVQAAGGTLALTGDADRAPLRLGAVPQSYLHACADAAVGALAAHHERVRSGLGQHVDVSAQQSVMMATQYYVLSAHLGSQPVKRLAGGIQLAHIRVPLVWPAKDGWVSLTFLFGSALGPFTQRLMHYVCEQGFCDEATRDKDWIDYTGLLLTGAESLEEWERVQRTVAAFTSSRTKQELLRLTVERGFLFAPVTTIPDLVASPQLEARGYFRVHEDPRGRAIRYPGPFVALGDAPIAYRRRAPRIGEHDAQVLRQPADAPQRAAASPAAGDARAARPLSDVKVLDFSWVMAAPAATRMFADYGATVVRIESPTRVDVARTIHPLHGGQPGPDSSALFGNCNAGKLGVALDLGNEAAREVVHDLVRWADVVVESFSPKAMPRWGFDYQSLRAVKPDLIMLSSTLMGQTGPLSPVAGFGTMGAAIAGFHHLTGWPDRPPAGVFGAYTDYVSPRYTAVAILAALEHRRRTGRGQYIDQSQIETTTHFLAPAVLDWMVNGHGAGPMGNADLGFAPHGVYPAAGEDRWIAIACRNDAEWRTLCEVLDRSDLAADSRLASASGRQAQAAEIDEAIAAWTRARESSVIESLLQTRGVAAHDVQNSPECAADSHLRDRGHFVELPHPTYGKTVVEGPRAVLSRTPARVTRAAPSLGQDNDHVLREILGYDDDRITALITAAALG